MATDLSTVTGVRQTLAVVLPVRLTASPAWATGPIPFDLGGRRTDAATRQTYFTPAAARALYGTPERPCRWHRFTDVRHESLHLRGIELLRTATARFPDHGLAVLHFDVEGPALLEALRAIGHRSPAAPDPLGGPLSPAVLLDGVAEPRGATAPFPLAQGASLHFMNADEAARLPQARGASGVGGTARRTAELFSGEVVVTMGAEGALWATATGGLFHEPAVPVEPLDRTGGGDAFDAGVIAGWLRGEPPAACMRRGLDAARHVITKMGAHP